LLNIPAFLVANLNSLALSVLTYPTRNWLSCDKSIILESIKSLKSNGSYTTEDVFTFLDKKGFEVSYRGAAMVGLMNTRLGILSIDVSGDHNIYPPKDDHRVW
jgi:hypothetical protein